MKLIIGLGNPGERYEKTRHNLGFMVVDELVQSSKFKVKNKFKVEILEAEYSGERIILAKPQTYMNNSGLSVHSISQYLNISISNVWVVHDDVDLPLGSMRIKFGGGSAGHNGVESIIESLGTEKFWRFRIGIGKPTQVQSSPVRQAQGKVQSYEVEDYVLEEFRKEEIGQVQEVIKRGAEAIKTALEEGMGTAMNKYNI